MAAQPSCRGRNSSATIRYDRSRKNNQLIEVGVHKPAVTGFEKKAVMWIDKPFYPKGSIGLIGNAEILDLELMVWEQAFGNLVVPSGQIDGRILRLRKANARRKQCRD